jgi:hypothetical protein
MLKAMARMVRLRASPHLIVQHVRALWRTVTRWEFPKELGDRVFNKLRLDVAALTQLARHASRPYFGVARSVDDMRDQCAFVDVLGGWGAGTD